MQDGPGELTGLHLNVLDFQKNFHYLWLIILGPISLDMDLWQCYPYGRDLQKLVFRRVKQRSTTLRHSCKG